MTSEQSRCEFVWRLGVVFAIVLGAFLAWQLASLLLLIFGGVLLAVIVRLVAELLARLLPISERWAAVLAIALLLAAIVGAIVLFGSGLASQFSQLRRSVSEAFVRAGEWLHSTGLSLPSPQPDQAGALLSRLLSTASTTFGLVADLLVVLFVAVYLGVDPQRYVRGVVALFPSRRRAQAEAALAAAGKALRGWLLGQLLAMLTVGVVTALGLWLVGVPLPFALGLLAGLLDFVPILGPFAAAVPGVLIAFSVDPMTALYAAGVYLVVQQLEGNLVTPLAQSWAVSLPPAVGIVAVVGFGLLFGLPGVLFATPLAVVIMALVKRLYLHQDLDRAG